MMRRYALPMLLLLFAAGMVPADGPQDNVADKVRPIPPPGIKIADADRLELSNSVVALQKEIADLRVAAKEKPALTDLIPDVEVLANAVYYALKYNEIYNKAQIGVAKKLLQQGADRAQALRKGLAPWTVAPGLVVRGYVSRIDGSVQPYGLVVPASYRNGTATKHRLDVWFHGRGETLTELAFVDGRQTAPGDFTPKDTFVLHPYGRYCNAFHFAGEVDVLEALDAVTKHYNIDSNRVNVRGFSMGGAAVWHFAVHYAWRWAGAAPGAGFSETPNFLRVFQKEELRPPWWEQKLWHLYDATDWAINLYQCPTVAYSGEKDKQKQAADIMALAMQSEGMVLTHIVGKDVEHKYTPDAKREIDLRMDTISAHGRRVIPRRVRFTTWTLRYNRMNWVWVDALAQHWERARVEAEILDDSSVRVNTLGVTAFTLAMAAGDCPLDNARPVMVIVNGQRLAGAPVLSDRSWVSSYRLDNGGWTNVAQAGFPELRKRHGLQGPIDDAFMDRFLMVRPTGQPINEAVGRWAQREMEHAVVHWRKQFRGELHPKDDTDVTDADIASGNLVLWGDPSSNGVLGKIANKLPIFWSPQGIVAGKQTFSIDKHVPVLIYPNPLNPRKYVVINSGVTFREYDYLNNARQVPKLPDWAILDVSHAPTSRYPAGIVTAGFFDEHWQLPLVK
jgi:predicted peptidase